MFKLDEIISLPAIQTEFALHRALSKVHRLFIEINWYQAWKTQVRIHSETRDLIQKNIEKVMKTQSDIDILFEYNCAKQAAKCLTPSESIWVNIITAGITPISSAVDGKISDVFKGLKTLFAEAGKDLTKSWYPDVHMLRWIASLVTTSKEFEEIIEPEIPAYCEKGGYYTSCLVTIFMEIFKNPATQPELKARVLRGVHSRRKNSPGLIDFVAMECSGVKNGFIKHSPKSFYKLVRNIDVFWKTRRLAADYLVEIVLSRKYYTCRDECMPAIKTYREKIRERSSDDLEAETLAKITRLERQLKEHEKEAEEVDSSALLYSSSDS